MFRVLKQIQNMERLSACVPSVFGGGGQCFSVFCDLIGSRQSHLSPAAAKRQKLQHWKF